MNSCASARILSVSSSRIIHNLAFRPRQRHNAPDAFHVAESSAFPGKQQFAFPDIEAEYSGRPVIFCGRASS